MAVSGRLLGAAGCHPPFEVDLQVPQHDVPLRSVEVAACAAGDRFDAGKQLHELHRLDEVVVRSGPQPEHHAAFVVARCQDQDGHRGDLAQLPQDLEAIHVRKAQVQQDHPELPVDQQGVGPAGNAGGVVAGGHHRGGQRGSHGVVVLDDQQFHGPVPFRSSGHRNLPALEITPGPGET